MTDEPDSIAFVELSQAKALYCRALDTRDWEALAEPMTADVEFGMSEGDGEAAMTAGRDQTLAMLQSLVAGTKTIHQVHPPEITLNGDDAQVIWAMQDHVVWENGLSVNGFGHYYERWLRQDGRWKISSMKLTHLLMEIQQPTE